MKYIDDVPDSWWRFICERGHTAMACIDGDHKFVWANDAWVRLVGYSSKELRQMTWMDITAHNDIGGDLASAAELIKGSRNKYTISKRYVHKLGQVINVTIHVYKFPEVGDFICFAVEAMPEVASREQLQSYKRQQEKELNQLEATVKALASRIDRVMPTNQNTETRAQGSNTSTINIAPNNPIVWIVVIALLGIMAWFIYQASDNGDVPKPIQHDHIESRL